MQACLSIAGLTRGDPGHYFKSLVKVVASIPGLLVFLVFLDLFTKEELHIETNAGYGSFHHHVIIMLQLAQYSPANMSSMHSSVIAPKNQKDFFLEPDKRPH
jgi:hypothetical protein